MNDKNTATECCDSPQKCNAVPLSNLKAVAQSQITFYINQITHQNKLIEFCDRFPVAYDFIKANGLTLY